MNTRTLALAAIGTSLMCPALGQHTAPNSWTPLIGASEGFPTERSGRAIHLIHTPPVSLAMGQIGKLVFFGRSNVTGGPVRPHTWVPPMSWQSGYGTFGQTAGDPLDYEAFCCGQTLMEDGKIVITGSNFRPGPYPQVPGPEVATYNPVTNTWTKSSEDYDLNRARYYPSTVRMPDGRIITLGGQATDPGQGGGDPTFVPEPFEINPNAVNVLATWQMPVIDDWGFVNYPVVFPMSQTELFFPGPARQGTQGDVTKFKTFYFS